MSAGIALSSNDYMTEKQQRIELMIRLLKEARNDFPDGEISILEDTPHDPPDVVVGDVGIEIREFVEGWDDPEGRGSREKLGTEKRYQSILQEAEEKLSHLHLSPVLMGTMWKDWTSTTWRRPKQSEESIIADQLLQLVRNNIPLNLYESTVLSWREFTDDLPLLASHLSHVVITRTLKGGTANVTSSGSIPLDVEQVERMVRGKESRLNNYEERYRQVWLLIMVGTLGSHSFARFSEQVKPRCIQSMFDRVCLCDPFWNPTFCLDVV